MKGGHVVIRPRAAHLGGTSHPLTPSHACRFQIRVRGAKTAAVGHSHRNHPGHLAHEANNSIIGRSHDGADICRQVDPPMTAVATDRCEPTEQLAIDGAAQTGTCTRWEYQSRQQNKTTGNGNQSSLPATADSVKLSLFVLRWKASVRRPFRPGCPHRGRKEATGRQARRQEPAAHRCETAL